MFELQDDHISLGGGAIPNLRDKSLSISVNTKENKSNGYFDWDAPSLSGTAATITKETSKAVDNAIDSLLSTSIHQQHAIKDSSDDLKNWFGMKPVELTPELKQDIKLLQLRSVLDPKRFYKKDKNLLSVPHKSGKYYFQIGTVQDSPLDRITRLTKKERAKTVVDELLANEGAQQWYTKKFRQVQDARRENHIKSTEFKRKKKKFQRIRK